MQGGLPSFKSKEKPSNARETSCKIVWLAYRLLTAQPGAKLTALSRESLGLLSQIAQGMTPD